MIKGGIWLVSAALLACTGCDAGGKLEIRSVDRGIEPGNEPVPFRIAEARGHLALGNVALALEGFRKAHREDPASIEALAGIADCYDRMGRFDLSRRHYEMALAIAPRNPALLGAFAVSLDRQGKAGEAVRVRTEIAALAELQEQADEPPVEMAAAQPVTTPAPVGPSVTIALPPPRPVDSVAAPELAQQKLAVAPVGPSVTIALPPPRPATTTAAAPRLERLSLTEVALVTGSGPKWKPQPFAKPQSARTVIRSAGELRLLNAARVEKLAARTRSYLGSFGWRQVAIGDAAIVRSRSLILYPKDNKAAASRLAARLGFDMAQRDNVRQLTILLGRDAAGHPALRANS